MTTTEQTAARERNNQERYEGYERWKREQIRDPRFASVRMLFDDVNNHGGVRPDTRDRFDVEERTWAAEVLNAPHSHIDRFKFDGTDIIVKESDGVNPRVTLHDVYANGLEKTRLDVKSEPGLAYQLRRDELFMDFYDAIEEMLRGETEHDTIHMISTCPLPEELSSDPNEAKRLMDLRWYDNERRKSFDYTARRLPNGDLELSATTVDSSNLQAHAAVLESSGYGGVAFGMTPSHEFGRFLSYENTPNQPIEAVIAERVAVYDASLQEQTGRKYRFGREDDTVDAHKFFDEHCEERWRGYTAYHELLAEHLAGRDLHHNLQKYLLHCLNSQAQQGKSVLKAEKLYRLRAQLTNGKVTMDMAMSCRELLVYNHHATLTKLLREYQETGQVVKLNYSDAAGFMDAYAESASSNGASAAANGEVFAGCETATSATTLATAAQAAAQSGQSIEQVLRGQEKEAKHCLEIQLYGFTIRRDVHCPFCERQVDARDTAASIECLDTRCGTILNKATGKTSTRPRLVNGSTTKEDPDTNDAARIRVPSGEHVIGGRSYTRRFVPVVGGARLVYTDEFGVEHIGVAAERIEATIANELAAVPRAR